MRIYTKLVLSIESGAVVRCECYEYSGPLAECITGSKGKTKSKQTSESESGTLYNEDFMRRALEFASGKQNTAQSRDNFDTEAYLKSRPEVATDTNYSQDPYQHWLDWGRQEGTQFTAKPPTPESPTYNPAYMPGKYTGANFTPVAQDGFQKLEDSLYEGQKSKLRQAYDQQVATQREELAQSGALNSPSQFLEGSARSSLDRSYLTSLQQAARDAFQGRLGVEVSEAGRRTAFDTGEAGRRTAFDTGEAGRQTGFNEKTASQLLDLWMKKLGLAIEAGRYSRGESAGTSKGGSGAFGIVSFGPSNSSAD